MAGTGNAGSTYDVQACVGQRRAMLPVTRAVEEGGGHAVAGTASHRRARATTGTAVTSRTLWAGTEPGGGSGKARAKTHLNNRWG